MVTPKGRRRREEIVTAAADILQESGPGGVSHRSVASRVGCSLSATTYYFSGLDELLAEAGRLNVAKWARRAEGVAEHAEAQDPPATRAAAIELVLRATLPSEAPLLGHYLQLVSAGASIPVTRAYHSGRGRINAAVGRVLQRVGSPRSPELIMAIVDGAAVTALSEGEDVRETATQYLDQFL